MGNLNKVMLIGHLGADPEKRTTNSGKSVTSLNLATTENWTDQSGNRQEKTEWHRVVLWGKQADIAEQYLRKGSQLYIEGSLQTREWQDKDGNRRWTTEINGRAMQFLDSKGQGDRGEYQQPNQGNSNNQQQPSQNFGNQNFNRQSSSAPTPAPNDFIEDDIPF